MAYIISQWLDGSKIDMAYVDDLPAAGKWLDAFTQQVAGAGYTVERTDTFAGYPAAQLIRDGKKVGNKLFTHTDTRIKD